ncbi:MAG: UvrB/UvrC motif-containing protein [Candidatus Paceibacterota bacterium]|jgi:excinuclease ABC subunit C
MESRDLKKYRLPDRPGVYFFKRQRKILYIGKATSLKDRVKSYFAGDLGETRGPKITQMLALAKKIDWQETDSVLEALLLETELIKKHQPPYNTREKDDKSYWYVIITDEDFPRILPIRGRELENSKNPYFAKSNFEFGPFPYGAEMKEALKIIRKIFPYRDKCEPCKLREERPRAHLRSHLSPFCKACFNRQIGLCPGVCTGEISKTDYQKIVRNIKLFFEGKKKEVLKNLEREMKILAKEQEFEKASKTRDQIFALNHIRDVSLLKKKGRAERGESSSEPEVSPRGARSIRIEAYDIAHLSGKNTTGAMVVWQNGEMDKNEYRKFKLKGSKANQPDDSANLREILERRFNHPEWSLPDIIVVDGNQVQRDVVEEVLRSRIWLREKRLLKTGPGDVRNATSSAPEVVFRTEPEQIKAIAVTKDDRHKASNLIGDSAIIRDYHRPIIEANAEAHRFALAYHRKLRRRLV